jgi:hypothetical protein
MNQIKGASLDAAAQFANGFAEGRAAKVAGEVGANELERAAILRFALLVRHGAKVINLRVRKDGREYQFEADWLGRYFQPQASDEAARP